MELLKGDTKVVDSFTGDLKDFYTFHGIQLLASKFPVSLIEQLFQKLKGDTYDAGDFFKIMDNEERETFEVHATRSIKKEENVFLVDHIVSFRYPEFRDALQNNPALLEKVESMTKYLDGKLELQATPTQPSTHPLSSEFDSMELTTVADLKIPPGCVCLSLVDNQLETESELLELVDSLKDLRVLWVMDNPLEGSQLLEQHILNHTKVEVYNSKLTRNSTSWSLKYLTLKNIDRASSTPDSEILSLNLDDRQIFNINLEIMKPFTSLRHISLKGTNLNNIGDINKLINLITLPSLHFVECDLQLETHIFELFRTQKIPLSHHLLINDHNIYMSVPTPTSHRIDTIHRRIFKITGCYRLSSSQQLDETSIWYVNDEFGSAITHTDRPQCVLAPFLFAPNNKMDGQVLAYTLMWLVEDVREGQLVERDFLSGLGEEKQRSSRLAVWYQVPRDLYINLYNEYNQNMKKITSQFQQPPSSSTEINFPVKQKYKVITTSELIPKFLTLQEFEMTKNIEQADIMWIQTDVRDNETIMALNKKGVILNQFPYQSCLVLKNNLANTIQSTLGDTPFLQRTYNLETQLPIFLGHFFSNEDNHLDNLWISKPPNMARSMDMLVSNRLETLIRNMETGPKLVQKYITHPVRRLNRKIDLRFIVLAKSISPLNIYLYRHFWIRTSNNEYNIDCRFREEYETHFTVMNYGKKLTQVDYPDFIQEFDKDYAPLQWHQVEQKIKSLIRQTFEAASVRHPSMQSLNSRAVYGIDIMVDETTMEPKLLEFTFSPDCIRACKMYPSFYNDIFEVLFLGRENGNVIRL